MCPGETNSREHLSDFSPSSRDQAYRQRQAPGPPATSVARHHLSTSQARQARLQVYGASSHVPRAASGVGELARSSPRSGQAAGPHRGGTGGAGRAHREASKHAGSPTAGTGRRGEACGCRRRVRLCPVSCPDPEKRMWVHTPEIPGAGTYRQPCVQALRVRVSTAGRRYGPLALGVRTPRLSLSLRTQEHPGALPRPLLRR